MKRQWFAFSVLLMALCLLAGCGGGATDAGGGESAPSDATPVAPAGWKTYTNTMYHYSLDYPENWFPSDTSQTTDYRRRAR